MDSFPYLWFLSRKKSKKFIKIQWYLHELEVLKTDLMTSAVQWLTISALNACRELHNEHSIYENIVCKIESQQTEVKSLEIAINELTVMCENLSSGSSVWKFHGSLWVPFFENSRWFWGKMSSVSRKLLCWKPLQSNFCQIFEWCFYLF